MGVYEGRGQLGKAIKELNHRWAETKSVWDDPVSRRFEEDFLTPMEVDLRNAVAAMDRVGIVLQRSAASAAKTDEELWNAEVLRIPDRRPRLSSREFGPMIGGPGPTIRRFRDSHNIHARTDRTTRPQWRRRQRGSPRPRRSPPRP